MKILKRICFLTLVAVIIQQGIFLFIENVYLAEEDGHNLKEITDDIDKNTEKSSVIIHENAKDINVSFNGRFISFLNNKELVIEDTKDSSEKKFDNTDKGEVIYYKWLNNENIMIVITKIKEKNGYYLKPISFNAQSGEGRELQDFDLKDVKIKMENESDIVDGISFSTSTNSLYIKVKRKNNKSDLYYINVMNQLEKKITSKNINGIVLPNTYVKVIMELDNTITLLDSNTTIKIPNVKIPRILGGDINDVIYIGDEVNGKINNIYYCNVTEKTRKWEKYSLNKGTDIKDIYVNYSGKIYIDNKEKKEVSEITENKNISYEGKVVGDFSKGIITLNGNEINKNIIQD